MGRIRKTFCSTICSRLTNNTTLVGSKRSFFSSPENCLGQPSHATHPHILAADEVTPRISKTEHLIRRNKLFDRVIGQAENKRHVVIVPSYDQSYMSEGVPYVYRQNSSMRYLSGFLENESLMILEGDKSGYTSTLFVKEHTQHENLWEGHRSGIRGSLELTGVDRTDDIRNLQLHLLSAVSSGSSDDIVIWYNNTKPVSQSLHSKYIRSVTDRISPSSIRNIDNEVDELRLVKSPAEVGLMRICGDITDEMFTESMPSTRERPDEHALFAKLDYECRIRGASNLAYLPVIAGGEHALAIHYLKNNSPIRPGDLVLADCGCDFHGYVSDVTRTWPVTGEFSEPHRQLYEAVEEVFQACLLICKPYEHSLDDLYAVMLALLGRQLHRLGLVKSSVSNAELCQMVLQICPHHIGHWLGMDVHDTPSISRTRKLEPNMVICIEPGMYLAKDDERVLKEFRGVGIRIENDILITEDGYEDLNSSLPTSASEIESLMLDS